MRHTKIIKSLIVFIIAVIPVTFVYSALQNPLEVRSFSDLVDGILKAVLAIGTPFAALAIIYSGFLFVMAQGNKEKLEAAKNTLTWSVIGIALFLGSWILAGAIGTTINALKG